MELPIDHFRLLGVSPSVEAEAVLRNLQVRLDHPPDQGFTHEALIQRAELLRLSADLLTDSSLRQEYEAALLSGASGLEISSNREVAGLILLWEADSALEAFRLACKTLQPPRAPALGSSREADLTLLAALSCRAAALQEQEQRHYESSALLLQEGVQLLQRMGKLADERSNLEKDLDALTPYRILDLVSRDLGDQVSHEEGLRMLDGFVTKRGGLEGRNLSKIIEGLEQTEFERFFQQIRKFLTVQEQSDLFISWHKGGSLDAGFLSVMALVAAGFSRRKPERIHSARKYLKSLNLQGLDKLPLLGCMDLLLADVQQAKEEFLASTDEGLNDWLDNYPGDLLAALCAYCRDWLRKDVLPGYRDVDSEEVDLEAWFADRDVQSFIENLDRKGARGIAKAGFSFLSSFSVANSSEESSLEVTSFDEPELTSSEDNEQLEVESAKEDEDYIDEDSSFGSSLGLTSFQIKSLKNFVISNRSFLITSTLVALLIVIGTVLNLINNRIKTPIDAVVGKTSSAEKLKPSDSEESVQLINQEKKKNPTNNILEVEPLIVQKPSEEQIRALIGTWLKSKAVVLSGGNTKALQTVARESLVKRVQEERAKDSKSGQIQKIYATITSLKLVAQTPKRIEAKTKIAYMEKRLSASGSSISETTIPSLTVTYILGREGELWQLVDYISGSDSAKSRKR